MNFFDTLRRINVRRREQRRERLAAALMHYRRVVTIRIAKTGALPDKNAERKLLTRLYSKWRK